MLQVHLCACSTGNSSLCQPDLGAVTAVALEVPAQNPGVLVKVAAAITDFCVGYKLGVFLLSPVSFAASPQCSVSKNKPLQSTHRWICFFLARIKQEQLIISFKCIYNSISFIMGFKPTAYISLYSVPICSLQVLWNSHFMLRCDWPWKSQGKTCSLSKDVDKCLANVHFSH